jgi:hypothetical protein
VKRASSSGAVGLGNQPAVAESAHHRPHHTVDKPGVRRDHADGHPVASRAGQPVHGHDHLGEEPVAEYRRRAEPRGLATVPLLPAQDS